MSGGAIQNHEAESREAVLARVLPSTPVLCLLALLLLAMRIVAHVFAGSWPDEGYYWLFAHRPGLSYFDHPPLGGWLYSALIALTGGGLGAMRLAPWLTLAGVAWLIWFWTGRLVTAPLRIRAFLGAFVVWQATPVFGYFQWLALLDHFLIFFGLLSMHFFALHVERRDAGKPATAMLFAAAIALGLAALTKYNAVFIAIGYLGYVLWRKDRISWLTDGRNWLAAALVAVMLSPILIWNAGNDWASFRFYFEDRVGLTPLGPAKSLYIFVTTTLIDYTPVLLIAALRAVAGRSGPMPAPGLSGPGIFMFLSGMAVWLLVALDNGVAPVWNITSFLFLVILAIWFIRSRLEFVLHVAFGSAVLGVYLWQAIAGPIGGAASGFAVRTPAIQVAGPELVSVVEEWEQKLGADMVVTTDYLTASQLAINARRTDILHIGTRKDMWDFWFDPATKTGASAVVLADADFPASEMIDALFETVTPVATHEIIRGGSALHSFTIYHAQGYSGTGPQ